MLTFAAALFISLITTLTHADPYALSGDVYQILELSPDCTDSEIEQAFANLSHVHASDPVAIQILDYARIRVRLLEGLVSIGRTRILPFEALARKPYRPQEDRLHIFKRLLNREGKRNHLRRVFQLDAGSAARYLASLNLAETNAHLSDTFFGRVGDLDSYNRDLARELYLLASESRKADVLASDQLTDLIIDTASVRSRGRLANGEKGPLIGLALDVIRRLDPAERERSFERLEPWVAKRLSFTRMANAVPVVPYYDPEREELLRNVSTWLSEMWRRPPPSGFSRLCSDFLDRVTGVFGRVD